MKIKIIFFFITLLTAISQLNAQKEDSVITIIGNLYEKKTLKPVKYAHVINTGNYYGTISDTLGNFKIKGAPGDTLLITAIGYENKIFSYDGEYKPFIVRSIPMEEKTYMIEKVEVTPWGTYQDFKEKFLNMEVDNPREAIHPRIWDDLQEPPDTIIPPQPGLESPISLIYSIFSREGKELRKYKELQEEKTIQEKIRSKYNREIVSEITGLENEELIRFMEFCNFSDEYLLKTRKYFILERLKEKYKEYKDSIKTQKDAE